MIPIPPVRSQTVQKAVWRGGLHFTIFPLPACIQLIGPPAGSSCCPSSSSHPLFLSGIFRRCPPDVTENGVLKRNPSTSTRRECRICRACEKRANIYRVPAHLLLNIHVEADKISPGAALTFTRKEQALKTCGEVGWRNRGEPRSAEGSLISLQMTRDTVVSSDTPDSKGDLLTARLQCRRNKQFIERACIHSAAVRLERWQLLMWRNAAIMSDTSLCGRKSNKSQTRIHWWYQNRISRTFYKDKRVKFLNKRKWLTQSLTFMCLHFVIGEIFRSPSLRAERQLKIKCPDSHCLYLTDRIGEE